MERIHSVIFYSKPGRFLWGKIGVCLMIDLWTRNWKIELPSALINGMDTYKDINFFVKLRYYEKATKGPGAKNATRESPGSFNQILNFESWKWSPVATFESGSNKSALSFFDFQLFHVQKQVLTQIVTILGHFFPL